MREDLLSSAVSFLQDPKVQSATMAKKVAFLESKGLTSEEIQEAVRRSGGAGGNAMTAGMPAAGPMVPAGYGPVVMHAPPPPPPPALGWKDYFIAAVVIGGVSYGAAMLAKRYIMPAMQWPSKRELEEDTQRLDEELEQTKQALANVLEESKRTQDAVTARATAAETLLNDTQDTLRKLGEREEAREEELKRIREELDRVRATLPKILEQSKDAQSTALVELQTEIRSLKGLLASRVRTPGAGGSPALGTTTATTTSTPAASVNGDAVSGQDTSAVTSTATPPLGSQGSNKLNALLGLNANGVAATTGRLSAPAWQLAGSEMIKQNAATLAAAAAVDKSETASVPETDTASNGEQSQSDAQSTA